MSKNKKSFLSILEEFNREINQAADEEGEEEMADEMEEGYSLTDALDHEILMHRDAHFAGDFKVMLDYYSTEHVGVHPDLEMDRIEYLAQVEYELGKNLAAEMLSVSEAERVARARRAYEGLKAIYEIEDEKSPFPKLLADLILTEEEEPEAEIQAVVSQGERIVPELITLINSEETYDPLFPGYGYAPYLAIICLEKIKDPSSIRPLFETLGRESLFGEDATLHALAAIGTPARDFLLQCLKGRPLTDDNGNAAFALAAFAEDEEVAVTAFEQLQDPEVRKHHLFALYLLCSCEGLRETPYAAPFKKMADDSNVSEELRKEIANLTAEWPSL